jgi:hypothetical protein
MVAKQLNSAPRDSRTVTGMIGSVAYRVSMTMKRARITNETIKGAMGILGEARLKSRRTKDDVYSSDQRLLYQKVTAHVLTNVAMPE